MKPSDLKVRAVEGGIMLSTLGRPERFIPGVDVEGVTIVRGGIQFSKLPSNVEIAPDIDLEDDRDGLERTVARR